MSSDTKFDIQSAEQAVNDNKLTFQKGDGLTQALMRAGLGSAGDSKSRKELQKAFRALNTDTQAELMTLAENLSQKGGPYYNPAGKIHSYTVGGKTYQAQSLVYASNHKSNTLTTPPQNSAENGGGGGGRYLKFGLKFG